MQKHIGAEVLAIDLLEEENGRIHMVEYNDIPGLSGFPEALKYELAVTLIKKVENKIQING